MTVTALLIAVLTFFILVLIVNMVNSYFFLLMISFMTIFIALSITPLFDPTGTFSATSINGVTELVWIQMLYSFLILLTFAKTFMRIAHRKEEKQALTED